MIEILPTIKVKHKEYKTEMVINECDYDAKIHEKIGAKESKMSLGKKSEEADENSKNEDEELKKLMGV